MKRRHGRYFLKAFLLTAFVMVAFAPCPYALEVPMIGRVAYVEGQLLKYIPGENDWVAVQQDVPFGMDDVLHSSDNTLAELIVPNGLWVRVGSSTHVQVTALRNDASEMVFGVGMARIYNKSPNGLVKAVMPFGYVMAEPGAVFDLYVGDQSAEVIPLDGQCDFISKADGSRVTLVPGIQSVIADAAMFAAGDGTVDAGWDDWNGARDQVWSGRLLAGSAKHIPPRINDTAYTLEENGKWEMIYLNGSYRTLWRPTTVLPTWQPFTAGRWTEWNGDQCWVPSEPFGYVTHHYGNWVAANGTWYWEPPAPQPASPGYVDCTWYPGRVAWVYTDSEIGWVPLAPNEVYYAHNYYGPMSVVYEAAPPHEISWGNFVYHRSVIVVPAKSYYAVTDYTPVRTAAAIPPNVLHSAPVVDRITVVDFHSSGDRFRYTNAVVTNKPRQDVMKGYDAARHGPVTSPDVSAAAFKHSLSSTRQVDLPKQGTTFSPKRTGKIVPAQGVPLPNQKTGVESSTIKKNVRPASASLVSTQSHLQPASRKNGGSAGSPVPGPLKSTVPSQSTGTGVQQGHATIAPGQQAPQSGTAVPGMQHTGTTGMQPKQAGSPAVSGSEGSPGRVPNAAAGTLGNGSHTRETMVPSQSTGTEVQQGHATIAPRQQAPQSGTAVPGMQHTGTTGMQPKQTGSAAVSGSEGSPGRVPNAAAGTLSNGSHGASLPPKSGVHPTVSGGAHGGSASSPSSPATPVPGVPAQNHHEGQSVPSATQGTTTSQSPQHSMPGAHTSPAQEGSRLGSHSGPQGHSAGQGSQTLQSPGVQGTIRPPLGQGGNAQNVQPGGRGQSGQMPGGRSAAPRNTPKVAAEGQNRAQQAPPIQRNAVQPKAPQPPVRAPAKTAPSPQDDKKKK